MQLLFRWFLFLNSKKKFYVKNLILIPSCISLPAILHLCTWPTIQNNTKEAWHSRKLCFIPRQPQQQKQILCKFQYFIQHEGFLITIITKSALEINLNLTNAEIKRSWWKRWYTCDNQIPSNEIYFLNITFNKIKDLLT